MPTEGSYHDLLDRIGALRARLIEMRSGDIATTPALADELQRQVDQMLAAVVRSDNAAPKPPDIGLAQLAGIGDESAGKLSETRIPHGVEAYDENVVSERMVAVADLYYLFQHEKIGVFKCVAKLKELFHAGAVRLSDGDGAFRLYQFDRREVLRYTQRERHAAYRRAFGYGAAPMPTGSTPNADFHRMYTHFVNQVALFWRDKRISDVVRERAYDPSFGSIAIVRRAGLDLRNNLKFTSFGHLNVMRVEVMQLLEEAFRIFNAEDVKRLFGVDNGWDVVEEILVRYYNQRLDTSPRQRMGVAGREVMRWLAQPHIMTMQRVPFESLLLEIAEYSEEWLTSAQSLGLAGRSERGRVIPWDQAPAAAVAPPPSAAVAGRRLRRRKPLSRLNGVH